MVSPTPDPDPPSTEIPGLSDLFAALPDDDFATRVPTDADVDLFATPTAAGDAGAESPTLAGGTPTLAGAGGEVEGLPAVPGYDILSRLGEGATGVVYLARHRRLKRLVALKMLKPGRVTLDGRRRLRAEAQALARLDCPHIVKVFDVGDAGGVPFCELEYLAGGSLDRRLRRTLVPPPVAARLVEQLARAVAAAHQAGVLHRDLKPANVLLQGEPDWPLADCVPKVTDFGLAKFLDQADTGHTRAGAILGTPSYMAPEQATPGAAVGPTADVYALGAILYECL